MSGRPQTKETRKRISETCKGKYAGIANPMYGKTHSEESRQLMSQPRRNMSEESRQKKSDAQKGRHLSEDTRRKISEAQCGENHYMYGKTHSEETKKRMSVAHRNRLPFSEEHKAKLRLAKLGVTRKPFSNEHKQKMRLAAINRIAQNKGQCHPSYNPAACKAIDEYGKLHGYNFQHAENGGEFYINELGYWVDGYDKEKNVVIEYYEKAHRRRKEKDLRRKQEIQVLLKCEFIELEERG